MIKVVKVVKKCRGEYREKWLGTLGTANYP
jgi:hypothetical protein